MKSKEELVELLKTDVQAFNRYRHDTEYAPVDLSMVDLCGFDLLRACFSEVDFTGANLRGANMPYTNMQYAKLIGADLIYANFKGVIMCGAEINQDQMRDVLDAMGLKIKGE